MSQPRTPLALLFAGLIGCNAVDALFNPSWEAEYDDWYEDDYGTYDDDCDPYDSHFLTIERDVYESGSPVDSEQEPPRDRAPCEAFCKHYLDQWEGRSYCEEVEDEWSNEVAVIWCHEDTMVACGRAHACWAPTPVRGHNQATWLANAAQTELGSAASFEAMHAELQRWGAPRGLIRKLLAAAEDERRHALATAWAACQAGAVPTPPTSTALPPRSLEAFAIENAVEGCVHETWAALRAHHQARHAPTPLRPLFLAIAEDETRHAELAWELHDWLLTQLDATARQRVTDALCRARGQLEDSTERPIASVGLPCQAERQRLLHGLHHARVAA